MQKGQKSGKRAQTKGRKMKKRENPEKKPKIERDYLTVFSPRVLSSREPSSDEESLEQPSALRYVSTTSTPHVEAYIPK